MAKRKSRSKYYTHVEPKLGLIKNWCKDGAIDKEIMKRLGISSGSYYKYEVEHPEFAEALKNGKAEIDYMVENSLLKRALGYKYKEMHKFVDDRGGVSTKEVVKEIMPDVVAQIFWLKNRKPGQWRDKQEVTLTNITIGKPPSLEDAEFPE